MLSKLRKRARNARKRWQNMIRNIFTYKILQLYIRTNIYPNYFQMRSYVYFYYITKVFFLLYFYSKCYEPRTFYAIELKAFFTTNNIFCSLIYEPLFLLNSSQLYWQWQQNWKTRRCTFLVLRALQRKHLQFSLGIWKGLTTFDVTFFN